MDVKTVFLNGELKEDIYMRVPKGSRNMICKLNKSIYGLKQSANCWFNKLDQTLKSCGFTKSNKDNCIYVMKGSSIRDTINIVLYVADL